MNCPEVEELMQRHLDSDLEEQEEDQLLGHIRDCPDCAALYQRLIRLSEDLTALPPVSPPVNIVDSILPRLDELDFPAANKPSIQAVGGVSSKDPSWEANNELKPAASSKPRRKYIWTALSGVAAAGLAIGMFIFTMDGPGKQNAQLMDSHAPESSSMEPARNKMMDPSGYQEGNSSEMPESGADPLGSLLEESGEVAERTSDKEMLSEDRELTGSRAHPPVENDAQPEEFQIQDQAGSMNEGAEADESVSPEGEQPPVALAPNEDTPVTEETEVPPAADLSDTPPASPDTEGLGVIDGGQAGDDHQPESNHNGSPDVTDPQYRNPEVVYERLLSPGSDLFAYVNEQRVLVSSSNGEIRFASSHKWKSEDTVRFVAWLNEQELLYQVTKENGESVQFMVNVEEETETEIAY